MQKYIIGRLFWIIPSLLGMVTILFFAFQVLPGDPVRAIFSGEGASMSQEQVEYFRKLLGLDRHLIVRYFDWIWSAIQFDLGISTISGDEVTREVISRIPITATLVFLALLITIIISIPVGIFCAFYQDKWPDYILRIPALHSTENAGLLIWPIGLKHGRRSSLTSGTPKACCGLSRENRSPT